MQVSPVPTADIDETRSLGEFLAMVFGRLSVVRRGKLAGL